MVENISFGILTVSDRCSRGENVDKSGENLSKLILSGTIIPRATTRRLCVPDDEEKIVTALTEWADKINLNVILTTGGTGFSHRDITPDATMKVIKRAAPGLTIAMFKASLAVTPYAMLCRSVCGIRGSTLIVNLPGSTKAAEECFMAIAGTISHAVALLTNRQKSIEIVHREMQGQSEVPRQSEDQGPSKVDVSLVARRDRKSPYPMVSVEHAQSAVLGHAGVMDWKDVNMMEAMGCVLAHDVIANDPQPPFTTSLKDGYAVLVSDGLGHRLVKGSTEAGSMPDVHKLEQGHCIRINTGAPVPDGADAVVQVENTKLIRESEGGRVELEIEILEAPKMWENVRMQGADIKRGETVLKKGTRLGAVELGLLATVGVTSVSVYGLPRVALLSTGNELLEPSEPLTPGKIRDTNRTTLEALLREHGYPVVDMGVAKDNPAPLLTKLRSALSTSDVVVTTGSMSMGDRDMLKLVLTTDLGGKIHFGRVFMKPGMPTAFITLEYQRKDKFVVCLPGNPVSAVVTFHLYVLPLLRKMSGHISPLGTKIKATLIERLHLDPRPEYHRAILKWSDDNPIPFAYTTGDQTSSRIQSLIAANALLLLPPRSDSMMWLDVGTTVEALLINPL